MEQVAAHREGQPVVEADAAAERPPVLSSQTTRALRDITRLFQSAPVLQAPATPETLSAL
ncbi:MAG: hypothetical protein E5X61_06430 [Mesorhizobium sp.]|nr:MAG: hypothetical protein E5X61_06430 [Mesorhizobium sp.]